MRQTIKWVVFISFGLLVLFAAVVGYFMYQMHQSKEQMREVIAEALSSPPEDPYGPMIERAKAGVGDPVFVGFWVALVGETKHLVDAHQLLVGPADEGNFRAQEGLYTLFRRPDFGQYNLVTAYMWRLVSVPCSIIVGEDGNWLIQATYYPQDKQAKEEGVPGPPSELDPETLAKAQQMATDWIVAHERQNGEGFCDPLGEYQ